MKEKNENSRKACSIVDINGTRSASKVAAQPPDSARVIGGWMITLLWLIALAAATYAAQGWFDARAERRNGVVINENGSEPVLLLSSNLHGQYRAKGKANDEEIHFLVDTGASGISIPADAASRLGLVRGRPSQAMTANGTITVYATRLHTLQIGPFVQYDVPAHINPAMEGDTGLLGMSFLRQYELHQRDGELVISKPF